MASFSLNVGKPNSIFTSKGIKEFCCELAGKTPSFVEVSIIFSKSKTRVSNMPINCKPLNGSP